MQMDMTETLNFVTANKYNIQLSHTDPLQLQTISNDGQLMDFTTEMPKTFTDRKFSSLTQRRKKLVDKYIVEVLQKSHEYDYGEFGSDLWSALLCEYFKADKDLSVGIDSIVHWTQSTGWGRRMKKAYEMGLNSIKVGGDPVREFELAKLSWQREAFRKRSPCSSPDENRYVAKSRGRRRKSNSTVTTYTEPDPQLLQKVFHDHDYCKNPWLESFGEIVVELPNTLAIGGEVEI